MHNSKTIGKREFIQHTSKYIKWVEEYGSELVITHQNRPDLIDNVFLHSVTYQKDTK